MDTRVPQLIKPLLEEYLLLADHQLPGLLEAFYLDGSLALGDFHEHCSDIDFIAVLSRRCTPPEVARLHAIHHHLERTYPCWVSCANGTRLRYTILPRKQRQAHMRLLIYRTDGIV